MKFYNKIRFVERGFRRVSGSGWKKEKKYRKKREEKEQVADYYNFGVRFLIFD